MLLRDLYRHRPGKHDSREAWLTACLAEVLDHDRGLLAATLDALGLSLTGRITVEHQRRIGRGQIADLVIEGDDAQVIIECKDRDAVRPDQLHGYADSNPGATVVLVAGELKLRGAPPGPWKTLSWQRIHDLSAAAVDGELQRWLRLAFREVLEWAGQAPVPEVTPAHVDSMLAHGHRRAERAAELRAAVAALQPGSLRAGDGAWEEEDLCAWWNVARSRGGNAVRGLGLNAEPTARGSLDWSLDLRPASRTPGQAALDACAFEPASGEGWRRRHLFRGRQSGVWEEEVAGAVEESRKVLRALGIPTGRTRVPAGTTPVAELTDRSGDAARTNREIWEAGRALRARVADRIGGKAERVYAVAYAGPTASGWFAPRTDTPGRLNMHLDWGPPKNRRRFPTVETWWRGAAERFPAVELQQDPDWFTPIFSTNLRATPLRHACETLVDLAGAIVDERRSELFSR